MYDEAMTRDKPDVSACCHHSPHDLSGQLDVPAHPRVPELDRCFNRFLEPGTVTWARRMCEYPSSVSERTVERMHVNERSVLAILGVSRTSTSLIPVLCKEVGGACVLKLHISCRV